MFWYDNWLGVTILSWLQLSTFRRKLLQGSVSNFWHDGAWFLLDYFSIPFLSVVAMVCLVVIPFYGLNRVLWRGAANGVITTKAAYNSLRMVHPKYAWCRVI